MLMHVLDMFEMSLQLLISLHRHRYVLQVCGLKSTLTDFMRERVSVL